MTSARMSRYIFIFILIQQSQFQYIKSLKIITSQLNIILTPMVFYGVRTIRDQEMRQLMEEVQRLAELRSIKNQSRLYSFQRQFDLSSLCNKVGTIITQGIISTQFVFRSIRSYLQRQWVRYYLDSLSPIINQYKKWPEVITQAKYKFTTKYSLQQRLITINLIASLIFAKNIRPSFASIFMASGKTMISFGALSFIMLPQYGQSMASSLASHIY